MTVHELKTVPPYVEDVAAGRKTFEVRHTHDRAFAVGDVLHLREWTPPDDPEQDGRYTGREVTATVTYLLRGPGFGIPENLAVMGIVVNDDAGLHRDGCESEFIVEAGAWTPCRCHPAGGAS